MTSAFFAELLAFFLLSGGKIVNIWHDIEQYHITIKDFYVVIEIPKGGRVKYELDKETGLLEMDRILYTATHYPCNYGFIPRTLAEDDDPLDVLVLCSQQIMPMTLVRCYPIGVIGMEDEHGRDEKILAIAFSDPSYNTYHDIKDLPTHIFEEIEHFFSVYKMLEDKPTAIEHTRKAEDALVVIGEAMERYDKKFVKSSE